MAVSALHDVDLKLLRVFAAVVEHGGFGPAQAVLNISLSRLSSMIAELERRLSDAGFYARDPKAFAIATQRLEQAARERATAEERWLELEEKRERLE